MNSSPVFAAQNFSDSSVLAVTSWDSAPNYPLLQHANSTPQNQIGHNMSQLLHFPTVARQPSVTPLFLTPPSVDFKNCEVSASTGNHKQIFRGDIGDVIFPYIPSSKSTSKKKLYKSVDISSILTLFSDQKRPVLTLLGLNLQRHKGRPTCFPKSISIIGSNATSHENGDLNKRSSKYPMERLREGNFPFVFQQRERR